MQPQESKILFPSSCSQLQQSGFDINLFCRSGNNDSISPHLWPTDPSSTFAPPRDDHEEPEAADVSTTAARDISSCLLKVHRNWGHFVVLDEKKPKKKKY